MSSNSRCVSCACAPLRWLTGGRHLSGGRCGCHFASAKCLAPRNPREPSRMLSASAVGKQQGGFVAEIEASADFEASKKRSSPCFGPGSSEARCERCSRAARSLMIACRDGLRLRPKPDTVQHHMWQRTVLNGGFGQRSARRIHHPPRATRLRCRLGLAPSDNGDTDSHLRVCAPKPDA